VMALQANAPIIPVAVSGGRAAMRKGSWIIRSVVVTIQLGKPVDTTGLPVAARDRVIREVRNEIERLSTASRSSARSGSDPS